MSKELIAAAKKGDLDTIKKLVAAGVNVFYEDEEELPIRNDIQPHIITPMTAIHYAIDNGHYDVVVYLIENFPNLLKLKNAIKFTNREEQHVGNLLVAATRAKNLQIFKYIYDKAPELLNERTSPHFTMLIYAVTYQGTSIVDFLLNGKPAVDVNERVANGSTALHCAANVGTLEIIMLLLQSESIKINEVDDRIGLNALYFACCAKEPIAPLKLLLSRGCYIDTHSKADLTLLETLKRSNNASHKRALPIVEAAVNLFNFAARKPSSQTVDVVLNLLASGAVNARLEDNGNTALHIALKQPNIQFDVIISILDHDADFLLKNHAGEDCGDFLKNHETAYFRALIFFYSGVKNIFILDNLKAILRAKAILHTLENMLAKDKTLENEALQKQTDELSELSKQIKDKESQVIELFTAAKRETHRNLNQNEKNYTCYFFGSFLAGRRRAFDPYYPVEAFEFLLRVDESYSSFSRANDYLYKLLASGSVVLGEADPEENPILGDELDKAIGSDEYRDHPKVYPGKPGMSLDREQTNLHLKYLIRFAIKGKVEEAPLNQYINQYIYGTERNMQVIPGFVNFNDPESCIKLIEFTRADFLKKQSNAISVTAMQQEANRKKMQTIAAKKEELQQKIVKIEYMKSELVQMSDDYERAKQKPLADYVKNPKKREKPGQEEHQGKRLKS